jgi:hypothetical protein
MWEDILKKPIRNPRADRVPKNDNLSMKEYEKLFEDIVDPEIENAANKKDRTFAVISLDDLEMSKDRAKEVAKELYADMGYLLIIADEKNLFFKLR